MQDELGLTLVMLHQVVVQVVLSQSLSMAGSFGAGLRASQTGSWVDSKHCRTETYSLPMVTHSSKFLLLHTYSLNFTP